MNSIVQIAASFCSAYLYYRYCSTWYCACTLVRTVVKGWYYDVCKRTCTKRLMRCGAVHLYAGWIASLDPRTQLVLHWDKRLNKSRIYDKMKYSWTGLVAKSSSSPLIADQTTLSRVRKLSYLTFCRMIKFKLKIVCVSTTWCASIHSTRVAKCWAEDNGRQHDWETRTVQYEVHSSFLINASLQTYQSRTHLHLDSSNPLLNTSQ